MNEPDELMTTAEVARMFRTPDGTLRYWRHNHIGPKNFRLPRRVAYWRSYVHTWLADQQDAERAPAGLLTRSGCHAGPLCQTFLPRFSHCHEPVAASILDTNCCTRSTACVTVSARPR